MSQLFEEPHRRKNPLTNEWVLVSPQRMKRPWQGRTETIAAQGPVAYDSTCYLCPRNTRNNGEINPDYSGTFIFDNDFPALLNGGSEEHWSDGLLEATGNPGICRVICFSPDHSKTLADMSVNEIRKIVTAWMTEYKQLAAIPGIRNIQIFENKGEMLGCSNPHPHGQIWAESSVPVEIEKRIFTQAHYYKEKGRSMLSDYLHTEWEKEDRIITRNEHFTALVPFWAVWPYEVMIIPHRHFARITDMDEAEGDAFASILQETTVRFDNLFQTSFPYSAGMMNAPVRTAGTDGWHFHFSFYPPLLRSATVRKFMVGYEMFANPQRDITAEYAAQVLREQSTVHFKTKSV
ncbi:UDP-glucose--hexose-1-phosphate uridylyltransferase [Fulvivirga sedimenti]|uniref:Galactose-1-phosphate uridylyltransferase n=1 Tax=Fulvivirga sedimenti TaxID=2879465 RepID=A0A9X1HSI0_9BACT|nr:UDP-glucose--hexose-1-phosphate uridylyltransferase [Fulvivirga sedimenti]MCA6074810.1 UDP-glucose--hexose-1-phosphate uridylyltransferase [Fulvivirga sedimenti]MCA6075987.1 UDP-glucose--hexose-1-phosphate uridylyltransferase [Fulvivirga sedimenti]MCA6077115.1 UDP-glucose--hexose-1-phosphate uridylyltransferase [Fulvivirga sedimenti]